MPTPTWAGPDRCPGASRLSELEGKGGLRRGAGGQGIRWHLSSCIIIAMVLIKNQSLPNEPPATTILPPPPSCPPPHPRKLGDREGHGGEERYGTNGRWRRSRGNEGGDVGRCRDTHREEQDEKTVMRLQTWGRCREMGRLITGRWRRRGDREIEERRWEQNCHVAKALWKIRGCKIQGDRDMGRDMKRGDG